MRNKLHTALLVLCLTGAARAQTPNTILDSDLLVNSRTTINDNFTSLYTQITTSTTGLLNTKASLIDCSATPGSVVITLNGATPSVCGTLAGSTVNLKTLNNTRYSSQFAGADCGAQVNAAYADLPATGGKIIVDTSCSFTTPIIFGVNNKPALLQGYPGDSVTMTYTAVSGVAITLNYGTALSMGKGIRDLTITGPGPSTGAGGVQMGGSNGAQGTTIDNIKIQSFGVNLGLGSNTWIVDIRQSMIRNGGTNVLFPSGNTNAGENIRFDHVTFADAPAPHTNSVWIQGGGQEIVFRDCSFDQAQLRIGNGNTSAAQVVVSGSHFENPNFATGGVDYTFMVMDNNNGNYVRFTDNFIEQDRSAGGAYGNFLSLQGGVAFMSGIGIFTPVQVGAFAALGNAVNVSLFGYNDLSGNTLTLYGGSTTGYITSLPGANTAQSVGFNTIIGAVDRFGVAAMSIGQDLAVGTAGTPRTLTVNGPLNMNGTTMNISAGTLLIGGQGFTDNGRNTTVQTIKVLSLFGLDKRPVCFHADGSIYAGVNTVGVLSCP